MDTSDESELHDGHYFYHPDKFRLIKAPAPIKCTHHGHLGFRCVECGGKQRSVQSKDRKKSGWCNRCLRKALRAAQ